MKTLATGFLLLISMVSLVAAADTAPPTSADNWTATGFVSESSVLVELTASDSESSVANISYRVNGGNWSTVSGSSALVTVDTQGNNTLEYNATDSAGNVESTNTEYVALDSVGPTLGHEYSDFEIDKYPNPTGDTQPFFYIRGVTDALNSVDPSTFNVSIIDSNDNIVSTIEDNSSSGLNYYPNQLPPYFTYDLEQAGQSLDEGYYNISVSVSDNLGNFEKAYSKEEFIVDLTPPVWRNLESNVSTPESTYIPGTTLNFTVEGNDSISGFDRVNLYVNDTGEFRKVAEPSGGGGGPGTGGPGTG